MFTQESKASGGIGVEEFHDLLERNIGVMHWRERKQGVAKQSKVGQCMDLIGSRAVLAPEVISTPVVAAFHASPMASN